MERWESNPAVPGTGFDMKHAIWSARLSYGIQSEGLRSS